VNVGSWRNRNRIRKLQNRLRHPWPIYRRVGGIDAVVIRANGKKENLGRVSDTYAKRWGVGSGQ
jgi:hypothetical protein